MTRFITATALATVVATGAFAQSQVETQTIEKYFPNVNVETLTELQVTQLTTIAASGESVSEKRAQMRALLIDVNFEPMEPVDMEVTTGLTEFERSQINLYAPELDVSSLTENEIQRLQTAITSGDNAEIDKVANQIMAN
ncbi:hypothetical protein [Mameliella alba]|uniref:DUF4168 domain-containing protein n=1 Tax=Mameliella alba TaxID=561184 RepID=A0A0B3SDZ8_9RHOB|nr:hypothetical protein [Mameliella alba]KHQ54916.1 hypothetical protein OA50_00752 [Mameliella alba]